MLSFNGSVWVPSSASGTDTKKVLVSGTDTTEDYLGAKITAGTNITINTLNAGANEVLEISATGGGGGGLMKIAEVTATGGETFLIMTGLSLKDMTQAEYYIVAHFSCTLNNSLKMMIKSGGLYVLGSYYRVIRVQDSSLSSIKSYYPYIGSVEANKWAFSWANFIWKPNYLYGRAVSIGDASFGDTFAYSKYYTFGTGNSFSSIDELEFSLIDGFVAGSRIALYERSLA